jgi:hypothetical protein
LDTPFPEGQSAIWCGSFQLAWNKLRDDVLKGPIHIQNAEEVAERLNRAAFSMADLAPEMSYAAAGVNADGIQEKIRGDMAKLFPDAALPEMDADRRGLTAFAYLRAAVSFQEPYLLNSEPFSFTDGLGRSVPVASFGIPKSNRDVPSRLREQIEVLFATPDESKRQVSEFALDLCKHSSPNQVVLACLPRKKTLAETLTSLQEKIDAFRARLLAEPIHRDDSFDFNDRLLVPIVNWDIRHHFRELEGEDKVLLNRGSSRGYVQTALQSIQFRLDPQGASVAS